MLEHKDGEFLALLADTVEKALTRFRASNLASVAWALATLGHLGHHNYRCATAGPPAVAAFTAAARMSVDPRPLVPCCPTQRYNETVFCCAAVLRRRTKKCFPGQPALRSV